MKVKAYTLAEVLITMILMSFICVLVFSSIKKGNHYSESCKKAGRNSLLQIEYATKQILSKYSTNYTMTTLKAIDGTRFSINNSGADAKLSAIYKKLLGSRTYTAPSAYTNIALKNESGAAVGSSLKVSSFTQGFKTKNGTYIAFKIYTNCTTNETYIYDPAVPEKRTATKSCGLIFFDTNADEDPNVVGVDMYIVPIGIIDIR